MKTKSFLLFLIVMATSISGCLAEDGTDGIQGPQGEPGADGADGAPGQDGADGANGSTVLMDIMNEQAGQNCPNGGIRITSGLDANSDGNLSQGEIDNTEYVCDGGSSVFTTLTNLSKPEYELCDAGGMIIQSGLDNGDSGGVPANGHLEAGEIDNEVTFCDTFTIGMVKDIYPGHQLEQHGIPSSNPADGMIDWGPAPLFHEKQYFGLSGGSLFFSATSVEGNGLWVSDGTPGGTFEVYNNLGAYNFAEGPNNTIFFEGCLGTNDCQLWKSDGTKGGTSSVKDIQIATKIVNSNGTMYFGADDGVHGWELWKSDGTESGTVLVKDIDTTTNGAGNAYVQRLFPFTGGLYFVAEDGVHGWELWKSDGTESGTFLLKDINNGIGDSNPRVVGEINGVVYFGAYNGSVNALWKTDGTLAGTTVVTETGDYGFYGLHPPVIIDDELFFVLHRNIPNIPNLEEVWVTDGTSNGTNKVNFGNESFHYTNIIEVDDVLYTQFNGFNSNIVQFWKVDGSENGTFIMNLADLNGVIGGVTMLGANQDVLYFRSGGIYGVELLRSDGTPEGTYFIDLLPGEEGSVPSGFLSTGSMFFLTAMTADSGYELFSSNMIETSITYN